MGRRPQQWHLLTTLLTILVAISATASGSAVAGAQAHPDVDGDYIVVLHDRLDSRRISQEHAAAYGASVSRVYSRALSAYAARLSGPHLEQLRHDPRVAFVTPDRPVQATGFVPMTTGDSAPAHVRRTGASTGETVRQASDVAVAVIDTGIDLTHPDLNRFAGTNCLTTASSNDDNGHGSHVAGTIGAANNGSGVVGVAPSTAVYAVKVLNSSGGGTISGVLCGVDWVAANAARLNIKVANMSLAAAGKTDDDCGTTTQDALHKGICAATAAGVTFVAAAGNSGTSLAATNPANYPEVLTVTAMSDSDGQAGGTAAIACGYTDDEVAGFSNYAVAAREMNHAVAGPGGCIYATYKNGGYATLSGTSMAAAHLSGSVALCIGDGGSSGPCAGKTPAQVIQQLRSDAAARPGGYGFLRDPRHSPFSGRYYGYLVWDGTPGDGSPSPTSSTTTTTTTTTTSTTTTSTTTTTTTTSTTAPGPTTTVPPPTTVTTAPPAIGAPSVVRSLFATQPPSGPGVRLFWQTPTNGPVVGYRVYRGSATSQSLLVVVGNVGTFTDTNTISGVLYHYRVTAYNGAGEGPSSYLVRMNAR